MRTLRQAARIIACTLGAHTGQWNFTHWNRIESRTCPHCQETSYRHAKQPA